MSFVFQSFDQYQKKWLAHWICIAKEDDKSGEREQRDLNKVIFLFFF